jgi:hypothetical protein
MRIEIETKFWNDRRYGKPWIAIVDFGGNTQGAFSFGEFIGDCQSGLLRLDAEPGDIVARGQKDSRNAKRSAPDYYAVESDRSLRQLAGKAEALKLWEARTVAPAPQATNPLAAFSDADLLAEINRRGLATPTERIAQ